MKKMTKAMLMTALICGTMYCGTEPVHANELDTFALDEYVVTATRTETKLVDTPANITIVGADEIESRHYTNVAEVLKDVPGATVSDNGNGTSEKCVYLNGDERVLVLVDGRRVNFDLGTSTGRAGYDMNQLPDVSLIERIEVMKGAGGALYGSEAVGGVINVITKKADMNYGKVSLAFGSSGTEDMNAMYSFKKGKTGVSVSASKYKQDYYKYRDYASDTTKRWPVPVDFENEKVSLKVDQQLNDESNLTIGYDYSKFEGLGAYSITSANTPIDKRTDNIYAKYDWTLNEKDQGYLQFYHNELDYYYQGGMKEKTNGIDLQQAISLSDNNKLVVGTSWRKVDVETNPENGKIGYDESIDNFAIFINDNWEFAPTWTLNAGVRYDEHSEAGNETTFSTGLNKKFNDVSHAYINWGQVFRAPTTDDMYTFSAPSGGYGGTYGNPNLKAETGDTWTIGYNAQVSAVTDIGISYFESDLEDALDWVADYDGPYYGRGYDYYAQNINKQEKKGLELTLNHKLSDKFDLNASYTYVNVKNDEGEGFVKDSNYVPNMYRLGLKYHDEKWNADLFLRYGTGCSTSYNAASWAYPYLESSYLTVDMALTYKANNNLKIFAKGYNLFNEAYAERGGSYGSYYNNPAQARRFLIGAEYSF